MAYTPTHLTSLGSNTYSYTTASGNTAKFDFSNVQDSTALDRAVMAIDTFVGDGGPVSQLVINRLGGTTTAYTDDFSKFVDDHTASFTNNLPSSPPSGDTVGNSVYLNSQANIINPEGGGPPVASFNEFIDTTIHETLHSAGIFHYSTNPDKPPGEDSPPYQPGLWGDVFEQIGREFPSNLTDPYDGASYPFAFDPRESTPGQPLDNSDVQNSQAMGDPSSSIQPYDQWIGDGSPGSASDDMGDSNQQISPLVLDLSGTALNLTSIYQTSAFFDLTGDGFGDKTGWIGPNTGLLCIDKNGDGQINDISELFGQSGSYADGFAALRALDTNGDGLIDASDVAFSQLRVWVNPEEDGVVHTGELLTLAQLGIVSISINATVTDQTIAGNTVKLTSTYNLSDGTQRTIADVWFTDSATYTKPDVPVTISSDVSALPSLNGYGTMRDLQSAATLDATLKSELQGLVTNIGQDPTLTLAAIKALMFEWAGSTNIDPASRGGQIDARELDFVEKYTGIPFYNETYASADPRWNSAIDSREAWDSAYDGIVARVVLQAGYYLPEFTYNSGLDFVLPTTTLQASLTSLYSRLGDLTAANAGQWELALRVANAFRMDARISTTAFLTELATDTSDTLAGMSATFISGMTIAPDAVGRFAIGGTTSGATLYAGTGIDLIRIAGGDTASAPPLNDTIVFNAGDGHLEIDLTDYSASPDNILQLGTGITPADIAVTSDSNGDVVFTVGSSGDQITIDRLFNTGPATYGDPNGRVTNAEIYGLTSVQFADGTIWSRQQIQNLLTSGSATVADTLTGSSTTSTTFDGGGAPAGTQDVENGLSGADTFIYNPGYGQVTINEATGPNGLNADTLKLGQGITANTLSILPSATGGVVITDGVQGDSILLAKEPTQLAVRLSDGTLLLAKGVGYKLVSNSDAASQAAQYSPPTSSASASNTGGSANTGYLVPVPDPADPEGGDQSPDDAGGDMGSGEDETSPLVLDLTGNGLNLTGLGASSPYFDLTGSGFARKTGWIGSGTGLLCVDNNGDGQINDITELFGTSGPYLNGFGALLALDSNGDGVIDSRDSAFSQLRVWVNPEQDGIVHPGELLTLAQLGIVSINLAATITRQTINGNSVQLTSTYTLADGTQRTIADAWFANSATYTQPDNPVAISSDVAALPALSGYGTLTSIQSAAMSDATLKSELQTLVSNIGQAPATTLAAVKALMLEWSGSTGLDPNGRGGFMDDRELDFLEKYTGIPFYSSSYGSSDLRWNAAIDVREGWTSAYDGIFARLVLQAGYNLPEFTYNQTADSVLPTSSIQASLASLFARLGDLTASNASQWEMALRVADAFRMDARIDVNPYLAEVAAGTSDTIAAMASALIGGMTAVPDSSGRFDVTGVTRNATLYAGPNVALIDLMGGTSSQPPPLNDMIVFNKGDGHLEVNVTDASDTRSDVIVFGPNISPSDVTIRIDKSGNLILTDGNSGDSIQVDQEYSYTTYTDGSALGLYNARISGITGVQFADGTSWSYTQIRSMITIGTAGADTFFGTSEGDTLDGKGAPAGTEDELIGNGGPDIYVYNPGYGHLEVNADAGFDTATTATLQLGAGITATSVTFTTDGANNVFLTDGVTGDQVKIDGFLGVGYGNSTEYGVAQITFADGTSLTRQQIIDILTTGTTAADTLYGTVFADTFDGKGAPAGSQDFEQGNGGTDTFVYGAGYGTLEIKEDAGFDTDTTATLQLGAGITVANVSLTRDGANNLVLTDGVTGDQVKLDNFFGTGYQNVTEYGVAQITFSDGTKLTRQDINDRLTIGTSAADTLYSTTPGSTFDGKGAPAGSQDLETGIGNGDTFVFDQGYGHLEINTDAGFDTSTSDTLQLGSGITAASVAVTTDGTNILLTDGVTGDQVKIDSFFQTGYQSVTEYGVAQITFADGTTWNRQQIVSRLTTGTTAADMLYSGTPGSTFDGKGAPAGSQDLEKGIGNGDIFVFDQGYGYLEINADAGFDTNTSDTLQLGAGITAASVAVTTAGTNILLTDGVTGDQVKIDSFFQTGYQSVTEYGVAQITFADGTTWNRQQILNALTTGTTGADTLDGTSGADTFDGKGAPANSQDYEQGNGGADTFIYNAGYGHLEINEDAGSNTNTTATLKLGIGITAASIAVTADSSGNLYLTDATTGDQIKIDGELSQGGSGVSEYGVVQVQFADGSILDRAQLAAMIVTPSSTNLYGTPGADILDSHGHATYEQGDGGGDTFVYNSGYGPVEVNEVDPNTSAQNVLQFGAGITPAALTVISNSSGDVIIGVGAATGGGLSDFTQGNANANYSGGVQISSGASAITLTNGGSGEAGSWFSSKKLEISDFVASFDYQAQGSADGMAFVLQDSTSGSDALGSGGGGLGYSGITNSAAIEFNLYGGHVQGTALGVNGNTGSYTSTGGAAFWNGDKVHVQLSYDGKTLTEKLTDLSNGAVYSTNYETDLSGIIGSGSAYVGFSGGTGGATSTQVVSNFTFQPAFTDVLQLDDQLNSSQSGAQSQYGVAQVQFADGITLNRAQLAAMIGSPSNTRLYGTSGADVLDSQGHATYELGGGGGDTFIYNPGYGAVEIDETDPNPSPQNVLQFGANISPSALTVTTNSSGDVTIDVADTVGGVAGFAGGTFNSNYSGGVQSSSDGSAITLTNGGGGEAGSWFSSKKLNVSAFTASFDYQAQGSADGMAFILQNGAGGPNALGGAGGGLGYSGIANSAAVEFDLYGSHGTALGFNGNTGNYTSTGSAAFWNGDKVHVQLSYDGSTLSEKLTDLSNGAVYSTTYAASLSSVIGSSSAYVGFSGGTGGATSTQVVSNFTFQPAYTDVIQLDNQLNNPQDGVQAVQFAAGTTWTAQQLDALATMGTTGQDTITGSFAGEVFDGRGGNDTIIGDGGDNTFIYKAGYGSLTIENALSATAPEGELLLGTGITAADLSATADASGNLSITDGTLGDQIKINAMMLLPSGGNGYGVSALQFADGSTWTSQQVVDLADTASATNTLLRGFQPAATFSYASGIGQVEITEDAGSQTDSAAVLKLAAGITQAQLIATLNPAGDVLLTDGVAGDQIKIDGMANLVNGSSEYGVAMVQFADGSALTRQQILLSAH